MCSFLKFKPYPYSYYTYTNYKIKQGGINTNTLFFEDQLLYN